MKPQNTNNLPHRDHCQGERRRWSCKLIGGTLNSNPALWVTDKGSEVKPITDVTNVACHRLNFMYNVGLDHALQLISITFSQSVSSQRPLGPRELLCGSHSGESNRVAGGRRMGSRRHTPGQELPKKSWESYPDGGSPQLAGCRNTRMPTAQCHRTCMVHAGIPR